MRGLFAYFTDLLLAPLVLPALGMPVEFTGGAPGHERGTLLLGVNRLRHGILTRTRRNGGTWLMDARDEYDVLGGFRTPHRTDPSAAGEAQIQALSAEIGRIEATTPEGTGYATLLSGGIDSGTVTYLAAEAGLSVTPYSVGTPWGDELDDAAELCAELGIGLTPVQLTEDQIIASIPEAIRWLGVADPEVVEVALTATSVQRLSAIPADKVLLTGYGSDLINAGLYHPYDHPDELIEQCLTAVDRTRRSNELSNRMPLAYGTATHHPFWSEPVMRVALETAPECKVREGREKFHLRVAMGTRLPEPIAWRKKIAVHHGGGLQQGVMRRLEKETGSPHRERLYLACFAELLDRAAEGELEPTDPWSVLEAAVRRVRAQ
jgi:asparagine synthetase B (glutamine-hydrolysing)